MPVPFAERSPLCSATGRRRRRSTRIVDAVGADSGSALRAGGSSATWAARWSRARAGRRRPCDVCAARISLFALGVVRRRGVGSGAVAESLVVGWPERSDQHEVGRLPELVEEPADASKFFDDITWARLRRVKAEVRPGRRVQGQPPHPAVSRGAQAECCGDLAARPEAEQTPSGSTPTPRGRTSTGQGSVADELCRRAPEKDPPSGPSHASQARSGQSPRPPRRAGGRGRR